MYFSEELFPESKVELLQLLINSVSGKNKVAILGGHFMLFYDKTEDELKPVIWQEQESDKHKDFAIQYAGDFPFKSFQYSLELYERLKDINIDSKIVLLVNDHKFQNKNFQPNISSSILNRGGLLRKKFYRRNKVPKCYSDLMSKISKEHKKIILSNDNSKRDETDLLPKETWFYSEQKLRKRFDNYVLPRLLKENKVFKDGGKEDENVFFKTHIQGEEICLTENGKCGCTAEVTELISDLLNKKMYEMIFFIPKECTDAVNYGIDIALNLNKIKSRIITITENYSTFLNEKDLVNFYVKKHVFE